MKCHQIVVNLYHHHLQHSQAFFLTWGTIESGETEGGTNQVAAASALEYKVTICTRWASSGIPESRPEAQKSVENDPIGILIDP